MKVWKDFKDQCKNAKKKFKTTGERPHVNKVKITPEELVVLKDLNTLSRSVGKLRSEAKRNASLYKDAYSDEWDSLFAKYELGGKFYVDLDEGYLYQLGKKVE